MGKVDACLVWIELVYRKLFYRFVTSLGQKKNRVLTQNRTSDLRILRSEAPPLNHWDSMVNSAPAGFMYCLDRLVSGRNIWKIFRCSTLITNLCINRSWAIERSRVSRYSQCHSSERWLCCCSFWRESSASFGK